LSDPFPLSVWVGWKNPYFLSADYFRRGTAFQKTLDNLLRNIRINKNTPSISFVAVGDMMLGRNIGKTLATELKANPSTHYPFAQIWSKLSSADMTVGNLECAISSLGSPMQGKDELRKVVAEAEKRQADGERTILFIDEIHRWNKAQQDALLPFVEQGIITLIGATTENPSFEINGALLSRSRVFILKHLTATDIMAVLQRAIHGQ
jgi:DNA polymerase III delta prime subunit